MKSDRGDRVPLRTYMIGRPAARRELVLHHTLKSDVHLTEFTRPMAMDAVIMTPYIPNHGT